MDASPAQFGHFLIARRADGTDVELRRSTTEAVFLAFDARIRRLVELHVLAGGTPADKSIRKAAYDCCKLATEISSPSFLRVLEAGEADPYLYFSSNLTDGELAEDYVARRGAVPAVTAFCLMQQFLDELLTTHKIEKLVSHIRLNNPVITTLEDSFLQLRVVDFTILENESSPEESMRRCVAESCRLLFLLLTGQTYDGQNPDQIPSLTCLPMALRTHMRAALQDASQASSSLERLRDDVREAFSALVSNIQARTSRKAIVVTPALQPQSQLKELLLANVPVADLLKGRFQVVEDDELRAHPFSVPAVNIKTSQPVTVHLLPPSGIVQRDQYEAVPLQMWRFSPERHPNILRSLSVWENPDWTLLTEEREPGFSLSRLMAGRITLNPQEVLVLLRQVRAGMDQAMECGVRTLDLHPSNLMLRVGKGGAMQAREFDRLVQKRLDAWPPFQVKLRTHLTMRSLYEPLLVEPTDLSSQGDAHLGERDLRHRSFLGLAVFLLTGERQSGTLPAFGEAVPDTLAAYLRGCLEASRQPDRTPSPADFIDAFEERMGQASPEGRGIAAIMAASNDTSVETEDAGTISDFDEEWTAPEAIPATPIGALRPLAGRKPLSVTPIPGTATPLRTPGRAGMYIWAGAALALLMCGRFVLFGTSRSAGAAETSAPSQLVEAHSTNPVATASHFSSAPSAATKPAPAEEGVKLLASTPKPAVVEAAAPHTIAKPQPLPQPSPAKVAASAPPPAPAPQEAGKPALAKNSEPPAPPQPDKAASKPAPAPEESPDGPVIIKKAILPTATEISNTHKDHSDAAVLTPAGPPTGELVDGGTSRLH